jgi:glycine/serine hydroxymethyltransferase
MKEDDMKKIAGWINIVVKDWKNDELIEKTRLEVEDFAYRFPVRA